MEQYRPGHGVKPATRKQAASSCLNCERKSKDGDDLFCRRHPPTVFLTPDGQLRSAYPPVKAEWRCGEWKKATGGK